MVLGACAQVHTWYQEESEMVLFQKRAAGAGVGVLLMETPAPANRRTAANLESWGVNSFSLGEEGLVTFQFLLWWLVKE